MDHPIILLYIFLSYMLNVHYCVNWYTSSESDKVRWFVSVFMFILSPISFPIRLGAMTYDKSI